MKFLKGLLYITSIILVAAVTVTVITGETPIIYIKEVLKLLNFN